MYTYIPLIVIKLKDVTWLIKFIFGFNLLFPLSQKRHIILTKSMTIMFHQKYTSA